MGVEGTIDYLADLISSTTRKKKKKQLNTVSLKVRMDCEGCGQKIKNVLSGMKAQSTGKKVEPWPYVPYELIAHPYAAGVYDKKAPPNLVRGTDEPGVATLNPVEEQYSLMFSDDNPNACSIM
ncbi:hypothetical protein DH2020_007719 [Rehmannia glutinosa]|uniref:Heavy metal-associated isoprenylated plant protein n=1 Tax=Rehmannia glutinosa TaxID=99300 RepID=A0ABR0TZZ3_REHGL